MALRVKGDINDYPGFPSWLCGPVYTKRQFLGGIVGFSRGLELRVPGTAPVSSRPDIILLIPTSALTLFPNAVRLIKNPVHVLQEEGRG
jgi:hypothetical protein